MFQNCRVLLLAAGMSAALLFGACRQEGRGLATLPEARSAHRPAKPDISPMNERDRRRAAAWAAAIHGLRFENGGVVVENPPAQSDRDEAARMMARGDAERALNHKTGAVAACAAAVRAAPDLPEAYLALGHAILFRGKTELASACFRTVIQMEPRHVEAREWLARTLDMRMRRREAIAEMEALLSVDAGHAPAHERLAIWRYYNGEPAAAWEHVHAARRLGHPMPPQFMALLSDQMPDPGM